MFLTGTLVFLLLSVTYTVYTVPEGWRVGEGGGGLVALRTHWRKIGSQTYPLGQLSATLGVIVLVGLSVDRVPEQVA